jgi:hypothetical protein
MKRASFAVMAVAGLFASAAARSADMPAGRARPAEGLEICAVFGSGFFRIPGTGTCIRVGGRVRSELAGRTAFKKTNDPSSFYAEGRLSIDARDETEWGPLSASLRIGTNRRSGNTRFGSGSALRGALAFGFGGGAGSAGGFPGFAGIDTIGNRLETGVGVDAAFVQWGGLTAGRVQSLYDFYISNDTWFGLTNSDVVTQALAYTYSFGQGASASLSIEDPKERQRNPIAGIGETASGGILPSQLSGAAYDNFALTYPTALSPFAAPFLAPGGISYTQRESVPDLVSVLRLDQGWGSIQLSAAYHRVASEGSTIVALGAGNAGAPVVNPLVYGGTVPGGYGMVDGNGYAIQGGAKIELAMLAAGDTLYLQAAYANGAIAYVDSGFARSFQGNGNHFGGTTFATYDAVVGPSGRLTLTPAYSALMSLLHYWTPTLRSGFFAGAEYIGYSNPIRMAAGFAAGAACPTCLGTVALVDGALYNPYSRFYTGGTQYNAGINLIWSPVKALDIGAELFFVRNAMAHPEYDVNNGRVTKGYDVWNYRLRVQREF